MQKRLRYLIIALLLAACGTPSAESPEAITAWRTMVEDQIRQLDPTTNAMGIHMRRYYQDAAARQRTDAALAEVQQIHARLVQLTPPPSHQALHALVLDATQDCSTSMDAYRAAFATNNAHEDAPQAYALLQRCRAKLERLRKQNLRM